MKCNNCNTENMLKACYCKECGQQFTQQEKDAAYNKTVFGVVDRISDIWGYLSLDFITGSRWFRGLVLVVLALYMGFVMISNGNKMKIMDSADYDVTYLTDTKVWCLSAQQETVTVDLYIPGKAETVDVITLNQNNETVSYGTYSAEDTILLSNTENQHYIIQAEDKQLEVYLVKK